jgi:hypothetical protein
MKNTPRTLGARLLGEHAQNFMQKLTTRIMRLTFEVERKVFFSCAQQGQ